MSEDGFNPDAYEIRHLSCRQRAALKARVIASAREERSRLLRQCAASAAEVLAAVWRGAREPGKAVRTIVRRHLARRRQLAELGQLAAMSDCELKDIGISRMDIRAAIRSGVPWSRYGLRTPSTRQTT